MLSNPVHAEGIIVGWLHFLLFVDIRSLGIGHLLSENFSACLAVCAVGRLRDGEARKTGDRGLLLNVVGLLGVGIVDRLRLGNDARLLVNNRLYLELQC